MEPAEMFRIVAVSLGLGMLVGLQRERTDAGLAGIRTFPLITLFGTIMGLLARGAGGGSPDAWVLGAGVLAVAAVTFSGNLKATHSGTVHQGITSEMAILAMYALGAFLVYGPLSVGAVLAGLIVLLLQAKNILHTLAGKIGDKDMRAVMTFVLISLVVLPAVPDRSFPEAWGLNPRNIWLMVVLVVGMSLAGYVVFKFVGKGAGTILAGVLGGLVSSTATTASYARRAGRSPDAATGASAVIFIAGIVVYARVGIEISLVSKELARAAYPALLVAGLASTALAVRCWLSHRRDGGGVPEPENPTELRAALMFAALYSVVLVLVAVAKESFGNAGVYSVAGISGLTDMDAITLSVARMVSKEELGAGAARRAVFIAAGANTLFKACMAASLGGAELRRRLLPLMAIQLAVIAGIVVLWPS
jgi:uncharacterized membrane protein (DUF4010 family)